MAWSDGFEANPKSWRADSTRRDHLVSLVSAQDVIHRRETRGGWQRHHRATRLLRSTAALRPTGRVRARRAKDFAARRTTFPGETNQHLSTSRRRHPAIDASDFFGPRGADAAGAVGVEEEVEGLGEDRPQGSGEPAVGESVGLEAPRRRPVTRSRAMAWGR